MYLSVFDQIHFLAKQYISDEQDDAVKKGLEASSTKGVFTEKCGFRMRQGSATNYQEIKKEQKEREAKLNGAKDLIDKRLSNARKRGDERVPVPKTSDGDDNQDVSVVISSPDDDLSELESAGEEDTDASKGLALMTMEKEAPETALQNKGITVKIKSSTSAQKVISVAFKAGEDDAGKIDLNRLEITSK